MKGNSIDVVQALRCKFGIRNEAGRMFLAEFLGTFLLVAIGNGAVAQSVLTGGSVNDFFALTWGYSLAVMMGVLAAGNVSGGHLNPAVTLALAVWGKLRWALVPAYMLGQYLGAFVASVLVFGVYQSALKTYEDTPSQATASIWATYPGSMVTSNGTTVNNFLSSGNGFADQVIGTMVLLICVCAIIDQCNVKVPQWLTPLFVGFVVLDIGLGFGFNCGYAINPARDLSPRIFTLLAGWGDIPFTATTVDNVVWWWIPVVAPHIGAVLGMLVYTLCIEMHHNVPSNDPPQIKSSHDVVIQNSVGIVAIKQLKEPY